MKQKKSYRLHVITCTVLLFIGCLFLTFRINFDEKITSMLPDSDPLTKNFKFVMENVPALEVVYVDIEAGSGSREALREAEKAADALYENLSASDFFSSILYKISHERFLNLVNLLNEKAPLLLSPEDLSEIDHGMRPADISKRLAAAKRALIEPSGLFMREKITNDPLDINRFVLQKLEALKDETAGVQMKGGRIWSSDGKHILILASPAFPAVDTVQSKKLIDFLNNTRTKILKESLYSVRIGFSGAHIATFNNSSVIQYDVKKTITVLSIGIVIVGLLFFSQKIYILLIFLPTTFSLTFAMAMLSLIDPSVSAIALGCGSVLIGITVDFGIHILYLIDNTSGDNDLKTTVQKLYKPLCIAACTTIAAFSSLMFSSLPGQRQMGLFASIGVLGAALFASFILIYFIPRRHKKYNFPTVPLLKFCSFMMTARKQNNRVIIILGIVILLISAYGITKFRFEGDVSRLNHLTPDVKADFDRFEQTWGISFPTLVAVKGKTLDRALEKNEHLYRLLKDFKEDGTIKNISSLSPILPSLRTQTANYENWRSYWSNERRESMITMLDNAIIENRFSRGIFTPFYEYLDKKPDPVTLNSFKNTAVEQLLDTKIISDENRTLILTTYVSPDVSMSAAVDKKINDEIPEAIILNRKQFVEHATDLVRSEFKKLAMIAGIVVSICLLILFRNLKIVLGTMLPVVLSLFITLGTLGILGIPINHISILFIVFVFGVGVDFSIFLMCSKLGEKTRDDNHEAITFGSVIICALTTMGAFITLIFAEHSALFSIGAAGLTGMLACLVTALAIVPAFTEKFLP